MTASIDGCFGKAFSKKPLKLLIKRFFAGFRGSAMAEAMAG
jgi:hypothetical protein